MVKFLAVFDFDHTIIDENSDTVVTKLLPEEAVSQNVKSLNTLQGWTSYMQEIFNLLFEHGIDEQKIRKAIVEIPEVPNFVSFLKYLEGVDCHVIIISDSNSYFIEEWLKERGIRNTVSKIFTNPAHFNNGALFVDKYHIQNWCPLSTQNLCKGSVLEDYVRSMKKAGVEYDQVCYIGDGHNDLCPSKKLKSHDMVFPRMGYPLYEIIQGCPGDISAHITPWDTTDDILKVMRVL